MINIASGGAILLKILVDNKELVASLGAVGKTVTTTFAGITAAATALTVGITKKAVEAFAQYEQLVGGVETLFGSAAEKVIKNSERAYKTAGVSANQYMQTVTGISASLISSLAGDVDRAADIADMALIDMADNAAKMGSELESIQTAYSGFAKGQYMLLDNLKLGYGGTKTEMERLLKDAQAISGIEYDISNLADVYSAIHVIQEELGITGTTAKEAATTISGSAGMMKASWENVLTAIAGGGSIDQAIDDLVYSTSAYFENLLPVVEKSLSGVGTFISTAAPKFVQIVAKSDRKSVV